MSDGDSDIYFRDIFHDWGRQNILHYQFTMIPVTLWFSIFGYRSLVRRVIGLKGHWSEVSRFPSMKWPPSPILPSPFPPLCLTLSLFNKIDKANICTYVFVCISQSYRPIVSYGLIKSLCMQPLFYGSLVSYAQWSDILKGIHFIRDLEDLWVAQKVAILCPSIILTLNISETTAVSAAYGGGNWM